MKLRSLQLTNFRCFESLTVEFDPQLTVLVANNGMGKTAVLEAIATGLGVFFSCLPMPKISGKNPKETDFRVGEDGKKSPYMRIRVETTDGIAWDRTERRDKSKTTLKAIPEGMGYKAASRYAMIVVNEWNAGKGFPIITYYGTGRAVFDTPQRRRNFRKDFYINDGYLGALDAKPNFRRFFEFFYFLEDLERREKEQRRDWDYRLLELEVIRETIVRMVPGFSNPHSEIRPLRFMVDWNHDNKQQTLRIDQLSDGFRTTLALVMDIASRLTQLRGENFTVDQTLATEGIVLIDEIDLHLHPSWQQRILPDLMRTFPNIQFIVTTHSPQVLSTIHRESIRILGKDAEGHDIAAIPLSPSYGEISSDVLESIMFVNPQPPVKERDDLERLTEWVDQGQYDTPDAKALFDQLKGVFGANHPQLQRLQRSIQRQEIMKG